MCEEGSYLSEKHLLERFNALPGVTLSPAAFRRSLRPLLIEAEDAQRKGEDPAAPWVYRTELLWQWDEYLIVRTEQIRRGEWSMRRPYSTQEMIDVSLGEYDDVLEAVLQATPQAAPPGEG